MDSTSLAFLMWAMRARQQNHHARDGPPTDESFFATGLGTRIVTRVPIRSGMLCRG